MYETLHVFGAGLPIAADLFFVPATLSPLAFAPFVLSGVLAGIVACARRSEAGPPAAGSSHRATSPDARAAKISASARGSSSAWISRTGGPVRL
jgi:hypothetical protein